MVSEGIPKRDVIQKISEMQWKVKAGYAVNQTRWHVQEFREERSSSKRACGKKEAGRWGRGLNLESC